MKIILTPFLLVLILSSFGQTINSVTPNSGMRGTASLPVTISGTNTNFNAGTSTSVQFHQGTNTFLQILSINSITSNSIDLDLRIENNDSLGLYDVDVYDFTNGWWLTGPQLFEVTNNPNAPYIVSSLPPTAFDNQTLQVDITGANTNFSQGSNSVWFYQGSRTIYPTSVNIVSNTAIEAIFAFNPSIVSVGDTFDLGVHNITDGFLSYANAMKIIQYSNITSIEKSNPFSIYPNPAKTEFHLVNDQNAVIRELKCFSSTGQLMFARNDFGKDGSSNRETISIEDFPAGLYFVSVVVDSKAYVIKLTKE